MTMTDQLSEHDRIELLARAKDAWERAPQGTMKAVFEWRGKNYVVSHSSVQSADPAAPPVRKSGASGRPPSFASKQIGELQREQRRYEKEHPKPLKKDVEGHLPNWP